MAPGTAGDALKNIPHGNCQEVTGPRVSGPDANVLIKCLDISLWLHIRPLIGRIFYEKSIFTGGNST